MIVLAIECHVIVQVLTLQRAGLLLEVANDVGHPEL